jgi:hypothetical protein
MAIGAPLERRFTRHCGKEAVLSERRWSTEVVAVALVSVIGVYFVF